MAVFKFGIMRSMERAQDSLSDFQPCRIACPYILANAGIEAPETCVGPTTLDGTSSDNMVFCWMIRKEVTQSGEIIAYTLPDGVEDIRRVDPLRWQELYTEHLEQIWQAERDIIMMAVEERYTAEDSMYVLNTSREKIIDDTKASYLPGEDRDVPSQRCQYLLGLRRGLHYIPNIRPLKTEDMSWEDAFKAYLDLRYPRAKGVASARLRKEVKDALSELEDDE